MPELPEVESIRRQLVKYIVGHTIKDVEIRYDKCFTGDADKLLNGKISNVRRFGKAMSIDLDNGFSLVVHIKMTGQLIYRGPNLKNPPSISEKVKDGLTGKHTHVIFTLDNPPSHKATDGQRGVLYYNDVRKFGWMKVVATEKVEGIPFIKNLGPEFLDSLNLAQFQKLVGSTSRNIKTLLMDQNKVAGVGNIYANDALFLAKIKPDRRSNSLGEREAEDLYFAVEKVLRKSIKYGGSSEVAYVTPDGTEGNYQKHTLVYGKEGEKCPNGCGRKIEKVKLGGRGTYFCPKCQK